VLFQRLCENIIIRENHLLHPAGRFEKIEDAVMFSEPREEGEISLFVLGNMVALWVGACMFETHLMLKTPKIGIRHFCATSQSAIEF